MQFLALLLFGLEEFLLLLLLRLHQGEARSSASAFCRRLSRLARTTPASKS